MSIFTWSFLPKYIYILFIKIKKSKTKIIAFKHKGDFHARHMGYEYDPFWGKYLSVV
jgi:hypothetical protein